MAAHDTASANANSIENLRSVGELAVLFVSARERVPNLEVVPSDRLVAESPLQCLDG